MTGFGERTCTGTADLMGRFLFHMSLTLCKGAACFFMTWGEFSRCFLDTRPRTEFRAIIPFCFPLLKYVTLFSEPWKPVNSLNPSFFCLIWIVCYLNYCIIVFFLCFNQNVSYYRLYRFFLHIFTLCYFLLINYFCSFIGLATQMVTGCIRPWQFDM